MIGRLRGELVIKQPPYLLVDVNGVGYELEAPMSTFYNLPQGETVSLFTHLAIREDAHVLYGFFSDSERTLFRALLRISGVGAKMALSILSGMSAEEFACSVQNNDTATLVRLPGIGKKTAERLIVEMRDRIGKLSLPGGVFSPSAAAESAAAMASPQGEASEALVALGYRPADAERMVKAVAGEGLTSEAIIRAALKALSETVR